jgi:hypothetical protein
MATFKDAFAAAKKKGKDTFVYDGKVYTTEVAVKDAHVNDHIDVTNVSKAELPVKATKLKKNVWPLQSELLKLYGSPSYVTPSFKRDNIGTAVLPYTMWMDTIRFDKIAMHKSCIDSFTRVMNYVWEANDKDYEKIKAQQLHVFSGCWNIRMKRGGSTASVHSWALAIDIAAPWNMMGKKPGYNKYSFTNDSVIVKAFKEEGWTWGGDWSRPDGMHFQAARVE